MYMNISCKREWLLKLISRLRLTCFFNVKHDWELTARVVSDDGGDLSDFLNAGYKGPKIPRIEVGGLPSSDSEFTCSDCERVVEYHRWAFVPGSGSLCYFTLPGETHCHKYGMQDLKK